MAIFKLLSFCGKCWPTQQGIVDATALCIDSPQRLTQSTTSLSTCRYAWGSLMKNQFDGARNVDVRGCRFARLCTKLGPPSRRRAWLGAFSCFRCSSQHAPVPLMRVITRPAPALPAPYHYINAHSCAQTHCLQFVPGIPILSYYSLAGISAWGWLGIEACFAIGDAPAEPRSRALSPPLCASDCMQPMGSGQPAWCRASYTTCIMKTSPLPLQFSWSVPSLP